MLLIGAKIDKGWIMPPFSIYYEYSINSSPLILSNAMNSATVTHLDSSDSLSALVLTG